MWSRPTVAVFRVWPRVHLFKTHPRAADARAGPRTEPASTRTLAEDNSESEHALRLTYAIFLPFSASFQWPLDLPHSVSSLLWS